MNHDFRLDLMTAIDCTPSRIRGSRFSKAFHPDPFLFGLVVGTRLGLKGDSPILKELLLPAVEDRRLKPLFVAEL